MRGLYLFALVFLVLTLITNIVPEFPHLPGDLDLSKIGIPIKIPLFSSMVISVLLILSGKMLLPV